MTDHRDNQPWGDPAFEQAVRETAYFLWESDGRAERREQEYWYRALEIHLRQRNADADLAQPVQMVQPAERVARSRWPKRAGRA